MMADCNDDYLDDYSERSTASSVSCTLSQSLSQSLSASFSTRSSRFRRNTPEIAVDENFSPFRDVELESFHDELDIEEERIRPCFKPTQPTNTVDGFGSRGVMLACSTCVIIAVVCFTTIFTVSNHKKNGSSTTIDNGNATGAIEAPTLLVPEDDVGTTINATTDNSSFFAILSGNETTDAPIDENDDIIELEYWEDEQDVEEDLGGSSLLDVLGGDDEPEIDFGGDSLLDVLGGDDEQVFDLGGEDEQENTWEEFGNTTMFDDFGDGDEQQEYQPIYNDEPDPWEEELLVDEDADQKNDDGNNGDMNNPYNDQGDGNTNTELTSNIRPWELKPWEQAIEEQEANITVPTPVVEPTFKPTSLPKPVPQPTLPPQNTYSNYAVDSNYAVEEEDYEASVMPSFINMSTPDMELLWNLFEPISGYNALHNMSTPQFRVLDWFMGSISEQTPLVGTYQSVIEKYVVALFFFTTGGIASEIDTSHATSSIAMEDQAHFSDSPLLQNVMSTNSIATNGWITKYNFLDFSQPVCYWNNDPGNRNIDPNDDSFVGVSGCDYHIGNNPNVDPVSNGAYSVTGIRLPHNGLKGYIPSEIGHLSNLYVMDLSGNTLIGTLPTELGNLSYLHHLDLADNHLFGSIPSEIGTLGSKPKYGRVGDLVFALKNNKLFGKIPTEIGFMENLREFDISNNANIHGYIPKEIGLLKSLNGLDISNNQITGKIPVEIGLLSDLGFLHLNNNFLTGRIPSEIGDLSPEYMALFRVDNNRLTGQIPPEIAYLTNLERIRLENNAFTGNLNPIYCSNGADPTVIIFSSRLIELTADCQIPSPEVYCDCCTACT